MARPKDTTLGRFYGLPKVHKDGALLRPIVSLKRTPKHGRAKWLFRRLKFLAAESDITVSSSAKFLEKLKGSINKCNDLPIQYSVLRLRLGGEIDHAGSALMNTLPNTRVSASGGRAIITPTSNERDALRELKADKDLVIVPADKGRSTVVLDRTDYLQKAKDLLEDRQFYVPCATNPVKALTREINATLLALENSGAITPTDRRMARPQDTALARFYGLPKVHKDGAPLRPIVSLNCTPTYGLAKWLFRRLKLLTAESDTTVSSSAEFLEKLEGLLKFCLRTYFTFDDTIYEQVKGTPMGSPISGFIAEAVLQRLESLVFQHHKPTFWARYVDDTFVVIDRDQLLTFKERLNAVFPDIQFTMEEEENNQMAFLDILVCRKDCGD
nr:unnamed protein product [Spirometra erinaceieuropaei]